MSEFIADIAVAATLEANARDLTLTVISVEDGVAISSPSSEPSTKNCTPPTPTSSEAIGRNAAMSSTVAAIGLVTSTIGAVVSVGHYNVGADRRFAARPVARPLAREVQATGAFFEHSFRLPLVLQSYLNATLPHRDRRDLATLDRRTDFRGGRRCSDVCTGGEQKF